MQAASGALPPSCLPDMCHSDTTYPILGAMQVSMLTPMPCHANAKARKLCWAHTPTPDCAARAGEWTGGFQRGPPCGAWR